MKKIILFVLASVVLSVLSFAQDATGYCKLPGTNDYVNVDFYVGASESDGSFRIDNQTSTGQYVNAVKVQITAQIYNEYDKNGNSWGSANWKSVTLYSGTVYDLDPNGHQSIRVHMPKYERIKDIKITVGNVICK